MFNRIARWWGRKPEVEQGPEATATDQAARRGKGQTVAESLDRYRQQRAEEERQAKEAYTREAEARYGPAATWPRLSETLEGPKHPRFCQSCGAERPPEASDEATPPRGDESDEGVAKANDKAKADDSAWCYGARHRGQSSDLWSRDKEPIPLLETILRPVLLPPGASARVFRRVGLHERSASRRNRYFLTVEVAIAGLSLPK